MKQLSATVQDPRLRMPLLALAILVLLTALWAGLLRMGWGFPPLIQGVGALHGPLMVCGFLGTLISLERAVAIGQRWSYAAPFLSAAGGILLITTVAPFAGALLLTLGSLGMIAIFSVIVRRQPALFTYTMAAGACGWFIGNLLWLAGQPLSLVSGWWMLFLVLTIVGERLELSRLLKPPKQSERLFFGSAGLFGGGILIATAETIFLPAGELHPGMRLAGAGMLALAAWLLNFDIARRTVRQTGLTRYIAWCLLLGYVWLGIGGVLQILYAGASAGPYYDAMLHSVFVGFVFSMIFGHMPMILPAVLGRAVAYTPVSYAVLVLLNISLVLRLAGDLAFGLQVRQWGGMLNVIAILLFLFLTGRGILSATSAPKPMPLSAPVSNRSFFS